MRNILILLALALPAFAEAPSWWVALHGSYLTADELSQLTTASCPAGFNCTPIAQAVAPVAAAIQTQIASTSSITYLPKWYGSVGGGGIVPGHGGTFAYEAISAYLGAQTYATTVQQFTLSKGAVQTCTMAGVSKILYQFGFASFGVTGLGGGCNSTTGTSGAAAATQGFASLRIRKSAVSIVATGDKTFTTDGRQGAKLTLGVSYGK